MSNLLSSPTAKRGLIAAVAAVVLGVAALGIAAAQQAPQTQTPGTPPAAQTSQQRPTKQAFLDALAKRLGITTDRLQQAIRDARTDVGLPAEGGFGPGFGEHGRGEHGPGFAGRGLFHEGLETVAQAIGITPDQLRQELPGKSLTQVAQAHGKNPNDVATALKNAINQRIDQAVTNGRLTADQAAQRKQEASQRIDELMTRTFPQPGQRPERP
jgi:ElaB/YqjD/DUF883 family membrane-anchored ribosome-binding protein